MNSKLLRKLSEITAEEKVILKGKNEIQKNLYTQSDEFIIDSQKLLKHGKLIEIRPHTRFIHFPKHKHNYIEVVYMYKGTTTHIVNDQKIILKTGDLLFLNQQAKQEILPATINDIAINFIILPEFFEQAFIILEKEETPLTEFLTSCLFKKQTNYSYLYFSVSEVLPIQNIVENMIWNTVNDATNKRSINQYTMSLLLLLLMNHIDKLKTKQSDFKEEFTLSVLNYIEKNYKNGTLTQLAKILNYDFYWLSREIKKKTGETFSNLLLKKRLSQAAYLLKNTKLSVLNISLLVGYENNSYFHKKFKKTYGVSPKEYR